MDRISSVAAFRSRQQVQYFAALMAREGRAARVISTPHEIAVGCGVSAAYDAGDHEAALRIYRTHRASLSSLVGFYRLETRGGRTRVTPILRE